MVSWISLCAVLAATVLVLVGVAGPVYAFLIMSCVSTKPCVFGRRLHYAGARCLEGDGDMESMLDGEVCTLQCAPGYEPSVPEITCDDGMTVGLDSLRCRYRPPDDLRPQVGGLVSGAVTGGERYTACQRAQNLRCDARPGGSSILLQLSGVTGQQCSGLLDECRGYNGLFHWGQHREDNNGTCTLGCFAELLSEEEAEAAFERAAAALAAQQSLEGIFPVSQDPLADARPTCSSGPVCMAVRGSCNADDNGDFYRHPLCASAMTQWVQQDGSHRIRYDGQPQFSQGGKWILELGADPLLDEYGTQLARQPVFDQSPIYGTTTWNFACRTRVNSFTYNVDYRPVELTLGTCTCTSEQDCSGHGQAIGSKDMGPNCRCICNDGWAGERCDVQLCKAPDVLNAAAPPCEEGRWLNPGQVCTPRCNSAYQPSSESFLCENGLLYPPLFLCTPQTALAGNEPTSVDSGIAPAPAPLGPCSPADCFYRGVTLGGRQRNGSCVCVCNEGYGGADCRTIVGTCRAPLQNTITDSARATCREGSIIPTTCTTQCEEGTYPMPAVLECTGTELVPPTFRCFGGPTARETWCQTMKYIAAAASGVAVLSLLIGCCVFGMSHKKEPKNFYMANHLVQVEKDGDGVFRVVRPGGREVRSHLPKHIQHTVQPVIFDVDEEEPSPMGGFGRLALQDGASPQRASLRQLAAEPEAAANPLALATVAVDLPLARQESLGEATRLPGALSPPPVPRLREGYQVLVDSLEDQAELNGARGQLVAQEQDSGLWLVALEGRDGVRRLPEHALAVAPAPAPEAGEDPMATHNQWLVELYDLEAKSQAVKKEQEAKFACLKQQAEAKRQAAMDAVLEETATERAAVEVALREGLRLADIEMVRGGVQRGKAVLEKVQGAKAGAINGLVSALQVAQARLDQYDEREDARQRKRDYDERVRTGRSADWKMTPMEFWGYLEEGNVQRVRAGLKAKLPIFTRSQDGQRHSVMHIACQHACAVDEEAACKHLEVVRELLAARAHANAMDVDMRTPLDMAISEGGEGAGDSATASALHTLGLRTSKEAAEEARAAASGEASPTSSVRQGSSSARPSLQAGRAPMVNRRFR